ncbi:MAG: tRNA lysidine(34) synthetase TilS [Muribaculaceae bacterium]|nr:tRNA lysidine(34) synthetase TilS [Muribaculaceae bacterium]
MKRKHGIVKKIEESIRKGFRKSEINRLIIGVSGGADSCALLLASKNSGAEIIAVHCNFHLRGEESLRDQRHVEKLCKRLCVPLKIVDFDVSACSGEPGVSVEMACRDLRYDYFRRLLAETGFDRIAVGHNADDNIETLLLNLFRGSGVKGLKGMVSDTGVILRPLLNFSRSEIEEYVNDLGFEYITDSSNLESDYRRNYIRNELLPLIELRWKGVRKSITTTIMNLQGEERVLAWAEDNLLPEGDFLSLQKIRQAPDPFWLIYKFASRYGATRDIAVEITDVYEKKAGSQTIVGKNWKAGTGRLSFTMKGLKYEK